jgi:hypothetical protein
LIHRQSFEGRHLLLSLLLFTLPLTAAKWSQASHAFTLPSSQSFRRTALKTNQGEPTRLTLKTVHQTGQLEKLKRAAFHALRARRANNSAVAHAAGHIDPVTCPQGNPLFCFGKNYLE